MDESNGQGWLLFAGVVLIAASVMRLFDAIWAFRYHGTLPENLENALFGTSLKTYGWLWLAVAILLFLAGMGVMTRSQIARWFGIGAAAIGAISAIWWMPYYPIWSFMYIIVLTFVIYALAAYGQRQPAGTM
jgi:hypothetical protein